MNKKSVPLIAPALGESITEATVVRWLKAPGSNVSQDETLVELETDKVTVEVNAPVGGLLTEIRAVTGAVVKVGDTLGHIEPQGLKKTENPSLSVQSKQASKEASKQPSFPPTSEPILSPASRKIAADHGINPQALTGTGKKGRITKGDVQRYLHNIEAKPSPFPQPPVREERVRMSRLRQTIAARLKEAQNNAACLTTFNEVDMSAIIALRERFQAIFEKKYSTKLGFMSFFVKACLVALREIPAVNAQLDKEDIVYKNHYDIGVAVGTDYGLVVPVIRDANLLSLAEIETTVSTLATRARENTLTLDDLTGGTFTITNGGLYGSLLSTPIINPPQSAILGMHKIEKRPVVINDAIEIRPMMYVALTYDHRLIDGKEAVTFLARVKECLEAPERIFLNV